jgi:hypothetical protein
VSKELRTFAASVQSAIRTEARMRAGLTRHGPRLVDAIRARRGCSLREVSRLSGLSPAYLSLVTTKRVVMSPGAYLVLVAMLPKEGARK